MSASCNPMDCSPPGSSLHGISQARILKWVAFPSPGDLTSQGANLHLLNWQADSLPVSHQGRPLGKTYWRAYIKWVEQRNVYSTEKKGWGHRTISGEYPGADKASEICLYELPRNPGPGTSMPVSHPHIRYRRYTATKNGRTLPAWMKLSQ